MYRKKSAPWSSQPQYNAGFKTTGIAAGIVGAIITRGFGTNPISWSSGGDWLPTDKGVLFGPNGSAYAQIKSAIVSPPFTIAFDLKFGYDGSNQQAYVGQGGATSSGKGWYVRTNAAINSIGITFGGVEDYTFPGTPLVNGKSASIIIAVYPAASFAYVDGAYLGSVATGTMQTPASQPLTLGAYHTGGAFAGFPVTSRVGNAVLWNRALTETEIFSYARDPNQIFAPRPVYFPIAAAGAPQLLVPISDVSAGAWTPSAGSDLYAMIDETVASDTDYISTVSASTCEVALGSLSDPASSSGHIVRYRLSAEAGGVIVRLRQGTTTIASWTHSPAPSSLTTYAQTLSGGEADSITDYTALKLQFEATE